MFWFDLMQISRASKDAISFHAAGLISGPFLNAIAVRSASNGIVSAPKLSEWQNLYICAKHCIREDVLYKHKIIELEPQPYYHQSSGMFFCYIFRCFFTHWKIYEPNYNEQCLELMNLAGYYKSNGYVWNNVPCNSKRNAILCEREPIPWDKK